MKNSSWLIERGNSEREELVTGVEEGEGRAGARELCVCLSEEEEGERGGENRGGEGKRGGGEPRRVTIRDARAPFLPVGRRQRRCVHVDD